MARTSLCCRSAECWVETTIAAARKRPAVVIFQRDLALGVGAQPGHLAGVPGLGQVAQDGVAILDRGRHQGVGLAAGIAEHQALVAGAFVLIAGRIDAHRDVHRLRMHVAIDFGRLPVETFLLVADVAHACPRDCLHLVRTDGFRTTHFAGEDDPIRRHQRFNGHPTIRIGF